MYSFLIILFFLIAVYWIFPWLCGRYLRLLLEHNTVKMNTLVLTFDDGPGASLTTHILQILKEADIKATFFLLGRNITGKEDIVKQIAAQSHQIASHSYDHLHHWKVSPFKAIKDIKKGWQAIDDALGIGKGKYPFRPPYGKLNFVTLLYLWYKRIPIVYWTVDSKDTSNWNDGRPSLETLSKKLAEGGVLLVHDFDRATNQRDQYVVDVIKTAIDTARNNSLRISTLPQLKNKSL